MARWPLLTLLGMAIATPVGAAPLTGADAYGDWRTDAPGVARKIAVADLPPPGATTVGVAPPGVVAQPPGAALKTLPGFTAAPFAKLDAPRLLRVAPNGDIFVAESQPGKIRVLRAADGAAKPSDDQTFAEGLDRPFGIAFYPPGPNPQWVYVANTSSVVRFPYRSGDLKARGPAEVVVPALPHGGNHWTRDVVFSADGKTMFVSVGSATNAAETMSKKTPEETAAWAAAHALGAAWDRDENRADVLTFDPEGKGQRVFAGGIRNCVGMAIDPVTGALWCSTNERDLLGDNLPPDYVTQVKAGGFYGWPWWYIGDHEDPRHKGERPDLAGKITLPDVLIQPHSAPLEMTFYDARAGVSAFPAEFHGDAFVALHGSWDRNKRTGYKIVRVRLAHGLPTGEYDDFVTGFVVDDKSVWGRPVGVTVAHDGALLFTDDGGDELWRVSYAHR
jgi:glucose/arabinose dehydrogenase